MSSDKPGSGRMLGSGVSVWWTVWWSWALSRLGCTRFHHLVELRQLADIDSRSVPIDCAKRRTCWTPLLVRFLYVYMCAPQAGVAPFDWMPTDWQTDWSIGWKMAWLAEKMIYTWIQNVHVLWKVHCHITRAAIKTSSACETRRSLGLLVYRLLLPMK